MALFTGARLARAAAGSLALAATAVAAVRTPGPAAPPSPPGTPSGARPPVLAEARTTVTDWGDPKKAATLEVDYQRPDVARQRAEILAMLRPLAGERILDVGCGPGFLMQDLAAAVGPKGSVEGADPSAAMCDLAAQRLSGAANAAVRMASAQALPYEDGAFDAVVYSQVLLYVEDVPQALQEARRVLRPGGRLVICDTDWDSLVVHTADRELFRRIFPACCSTFVHAHLPPALPGMLKGAGLDLSGVQTLAMVSAGREQVNNTFMGNWAFRVVPQKARGYGLPEADVEKWLEEQTSLRDVGAFFACVHRFLFLARKPA